MNRAGIIVAGGDSRRMGRDKTRLPLGDRTVLERVAVKLQSCCDELLIVSKAEASVQVAGIAQYADLIPHAGPLGGIYTGLSYSQSPWNFVAAGDMPFIAGTLINRMFDIAESGGHDAVVPERGGKLHPLHAVYRRDCAAALAERLRRGERKVTDWVRCLNVYILAEAELAQSDPSGWSLFNMNTPDDYEAALRRLISLDEL